MSAKEGKSVTQKGPGCSFGSSGLSKCPLDINIQDTNRNPDLGTSRMNMEPPLAMTFRFGSLPNFRSTTRGGHCVM